MEKQIKQIEQEVKKTTKEVRKAIAQCDVTIGNLLIDFATRYNEIMRTIETGKATIAKEVRE